MTDEQRDYSDVTWPWDDDPCWAAPREGATSDPEDKDNWTLACGACALRFPMDTGMTVGVIADHWDNLHAVEHGPSEEGALKLHLVWIGLGTPPQPPPDLHT